MGARDHANYRGSHEGYGKAADHWQAAHDHRAVRDGIGRTVDRLWGDEEPDGDRAAFDV